MKRLILTAITALSLVLVPVTAPAQSRLEGQELLGILLGLGALAAIAKEVRDRDDEKEKARAARKLAPVQRHKPSAPVYDEFHYDHDYRRPVRHSDFLPANCRRGDVRLKDNSRVLGARCLRRFDVETRRLPERCRHRVTTQGGPRTVFGIRCLRRSGYEVARLN
ncbi:MAG: hypothetical protein AAGK37_13695 [Pseudomonadota bacterium]